MKVTHANFKKNLERLSKDENIIEPEAFHHFRFCLFCIPGALDMPEDQRLCPEGLSYLHRMREARSNGGCEKEPKA